MRHADLIQYRFELWSPSGRAIARTANRRPASYCAMDVSALSAILMFMLFLFMIIQPPFHRLHVDLCKIRGPTYLPGAIMEDALRVSLTRDGQFFFGTRNVSPNDLLNEIRDPLQLGAPRALYFSVDYRAKYADVATVLDSVRPTKIRNVTFLTE
jgi:biopolymer transport protein ExbD